MTPKTMRVLAAIALPVGFVTTAFTNNPTGFYVGVFAAVLFVVCAAMLPKK